jgi:ABC-2 type transport system ATP-binding protein
MPSLQNNPSPGCGPQNQPPDLVALGRGLSAYFRDFTICALDDIDIEVRRGDLFGVVGPAGAGKSTLLKIVAGRLRPAYGTVKVFGCSPARAAARARTGYVPDQTPGKDRPRFGVISRLAAKFFGPAHPASLARVLRRNPELIILDNPFAGQDAAARQAARELILSLRREGRTVLLSSQSLVEVKDLCNRIAILRGGRIEAMGTLEELLAPPGAVRYLAPVLPETMLTRALKLIRADLGLPKTSPGPQDPWPDAPPPQPGPPATVSPAEKMLRSLVKETPGPTASPGAGG